MDEQQRTADIARAAVSQLAPEELALFDVTWPAYLASPARIRARGRRQDDMIAFGVDMVVPLVTAAALTAAGAALQLIAERAGESFGRRVLRRLRQLLRRGRQPAAVSGAVDLTPEMITRIRQVAHRQALAFDLSDERAGLLADAIVGGLVNPDR